MTTDDTNPLDPDLDREIREALGESSLLGVDRTKRAAAPSRMPGELVVPDLVEPDVGSFANGKVVGVGRDDVFVEFGPRAQGVVPVEQFGTLPEHGDVVRLFIESHDAKEGIYLCNLKKAAQRASGWESVEEGSVVVGTVRAENKGGLEVQVGHMSAFLPASHASLERIEDLSTLIGETFPLEVIEADGERRRLVVSRRAVLARERAEKSAAAMRSLQEGDVVSGTVARVEKFGAFVDIGGVDGLVHVSQMSWDRVEDPADVVKVGDVVKVQVLSVSETDGRIALSMKQLIEDPWNVFVRDHPPGSVVEGTVTRIAHFGAFIKVADGVEGLAHVSELAPGGVGSPKEVLRPGQTVGVRIANFEAERRRIGLSLLTERGDRLTDDVADDQTIREVLQRGAADDPEPTLGDLLRRAMEGQS